MNEKQQLECKVKELTKQIKDTSLTVENLQGDKKLKFYTGKATRLNILHLHFIHLQG